MLLFFNIGLIACTLGAAMSGLGGDTWDKAKTHLILPYRFTRRGWSLLFFIVVGFLLGVTKEIKTSRDSVRKDVATKRERDADRALAASNQRALIGQLNDAQANLQHTQRQLDDVIGQVVAEKRTADSTFGTLNKTRDKLDQANTNNLVSSAIGFDKTVQELWLLAVSRRSFHSEDEFNAAIGVDMGTPNCPIAGRGVLTFFYEYPEDLIWRDQRHLPDIYEQVTSVNNTSALINSNTMDENWRRLVPSATGLPDLLYRGVSV